LGHYLLGNVLFAIKGIDMDVNILKVKGTVNKKVLYKNLHIYDGTEVFNSCETVFDELKDIIYSMKIITAYIFTDNLPFQIEENAEKYVICYVSSDKDINTLANDFISKGEYLKGYLLSEMATQAIFNASDEMVYKIMYDLKKQGYGIRRRYAPGDGNIGLEYQGRIINELRKYTSVDIYINEQNVMVPENSLLYIYTVTKGGNCEINQCKECTNKYCVYKKAD